MTSSSDNTLQQEDVVTVNVQEVKKYLLEHPDFFQQNAEVLSELALKHDSGVATSLLERQVQALRKKNDDLEKNMLNLLRLAHDNEELQKKSQRITLRLLEIENDEHVVEHINSILIDEFSSLDVCMVFNRWPEFVNMPEQSKLSDKEMSLDVCQSLLIKDQGGCVFSKSLVEQFFTQPSSIQSAVAVPLGNPVGTKKSQQADSQKRKNFGILIFGSTDKTRFNEGMGTMFLEHLASLLSAKLSRCFKLAR